MPWIIKLIFTVTYSDVFWNWKRERIWTKYSVWKFLWKNKILKFIHYILNTLKKFLEQPQSFLGIILISLHGKWECDSHKKINTLSSCTWLCDYVYIEICRNEGSNLRILLLNNILNSSENINNMRTSRISI